MNNISVNIFDKIQSLCQEFRRQLKRGENRGIEEYLSMASGSSKPILFQNLLHIDLEFRRRQGENPGSDDYIQRFPQFAQLIRQAFFESTMMSQHLRDTPADENTVIVGMPAARKLGEYELLEELGRGGFGVVYKARHLGRNQLVALKTLPTDFSEQSHHATEADRLHKFRQEFRSLADVNHPNLIGMQTLEVEGQQWFLTMDLIEGIDFLSYVRPHSKLDEDRLQATLRQLVVGLSALHAKRIVHRDLKPSNVMVENDGHVVILDFGLVAKLQKADETASLRSQSFAGTPRYAAPEQAHGEWSEESDWYALGVMIYEALTGQAPFNGSAVEVMMKKQHGTAPQLSERSDLPQKVCRLTDALLERQPSERPAVQTIANVVGIQIDSASRDSTFTQLRGDSTQSEWLLVGRDSQLAELEAARRELTATKLPKVVWVRGRSGEGKTSLVEKFIAPLRRSRELLVLSGRCYDRESVPFKAIDSLIDSLVSSLRSRTPDDILPDDIPMLAHLFPVLKRVEAIADRATISLTGIDSRQIRYRAFAALRELLTTIGRSTPVLLFIDDLQWGDADSAAALHELLLPPDAPAVMLLGSYRSDEAEESPFLREWRERNPEADPKLDEKVIEVSPLTAEQCLSMFAARVGCHIEALQEQMKDVFHGTQGNPYFLEQLIEGFDAESGQFEAVPLQEIIARKLQRLPLAAGPLLETIAVAGQSVRIDEVTHVSDQASNAYSAITHMRSERLVRLIGSSDHQLVDTYHDKIRETVLDGLAESEKQKLHIQFGEYIESAEAVTAEDMLKQLTRDVTLEAIEIPSSNRIFDLAYHFHAADDPRGFAYQMAAGELSFEAYASEDAFEYLNRAAAHCPSDIAQRIRFRLQYRLGKTLTRLREFDLALTHFKHATKEANTPLQHAVVFAGIAATYQVRSNYQSALDFYDKALTQLNMPRPKGLAAILKCVSQALRLATRPPKWRADSNCETAEIARHSLVQEIYIDLVAMIWELADGVISYPFIMLQMQNISRYVQNPGVWCVGVATSAASFAINGFPWLGKWLLKKAEPVEQQINDKESKGTFLMGSAVTNHYASKPSLADEQYSLAFEHLTQAGFHTYSCLAAHMHRHLHAVIASSSVELESARRTLQTAQAVDDQRTQCWGHYDIANALARLGDVTAALEHIEAARGFLQTGERYLTDAIFLCTEGYVRIQASAYEAARFSLEAGWYLVKSRKLLMNVSVRALPYLIESLVGPNWTQPIDPVVRKRLKRLCRVAIGMDWLYPDIASPAQRSRGRAYAAKGNTRKAVRCFAKAIRRADEFGAEYDRAKSLLDLAAVQTNGQDKLRQEAIKVLKKMESVIPRAESWLLGDQYDEQVVAPERFDVAPDHSIIASS
ncbi:serine/threonine protein kinase [Thalassoroseus pseudoceratinae]|uniref:serine/threonine protein kinase n=1 Tax=Thalassoroseus pseudoceratinae TaxID=2713176 RepID=UPI001423D111|nr:serine/threonine-protein kinase [Thalassoroseus pseudoceratinae]